MAESLQGLEDVIRYEGPHTIAAVFLETIVGTNGILIPPDGYLQGVREICDRYDILMVADEVMAGFGRTGRWFAVDHAGRDPRPDDDGQGPDQLVPAPRRRRDEPQDRREVRLPRCSTAASPTAATRSAWRPPWPRSGSTRRTGSSRTRPGSARSCGPITSGSMRSTRRSAPIGTSGLFGIIDLVRSRDPFTPLTPFNGTSDEMKAIGKYLREPRPVHDDRQQLDPHQPTAVHHRGAAGRGLRGHRRGPRHRRRGGPRLARWRSSDHRRSRRSRRPDRGTLARRSATRRRARPCDGVDLDGRPGRVRLDHRPVRLRQVDPPADRRRPGRTHRRGRGSSTASRPPGRGSIATTASSSRPRS